MDADALDPTSYTAQRLQHATPEHLYLTSRRCFIGPIPEGWLKSHRRDWYKHHLHINYSSRAATFSTDLRVTHDRRTSGLDGPRTSKPFRPSFPQPDDIDEDHATGDGTASVGASVTVPRASHADGEIVDEELARRHRRTQSRTTPVPTQLEETSETQEDSGRGLVKFDIPEDSKRAEIQAKARMAQTHVRRKGARLRKSKLRDGQIVKMDKMLVRVDTTFSEIGEEFDENEAHKVESRTTEKWREYMVVCRDNHEADEDFPFVLQMYKSRVIAAVEASKNKKKAKHEVRLGPKYTKVNLYSSLDKTVVIWTPWRKGTKIFIMRPHSGSSAAEWYTFLRNILGWNRASELQVNVPGLDVSLRLENPFQELESSKEIQEAAKGNAEAMVKAVQQEQAVAKNIMNRAIDMLIQTPDYSEVVNPYPIKDEQIEWLADGNEFSSADVRHRDRDAADEADRKTNLLLKCDGYINLCNIKKVRKVHRGAAAADENMEEGSDVDFDLDVDDTMEDDGTTHEFDDERTFELVLTNGLIIRLQAFDKMTKKEWMNRLRQLVKYWKYRTATDIQLYKNIRKYNLDLLNIDEETEAIVGQFARKWEVLHAHASSELYNMCGISACRSIHISGILFRKPRRHGTFTRCSVILSAGTLLIFQDSVRTSTGKQLAHIHHEHISTLDLRDCYLYSGMLTEGDLLYQNRTFDNNRPGHTALPRIYLEDGWTSTDEDYMTCFALWHGRKKSLFRRGGIEPRDEKEVVEKEGGRRSRFKLVSQLGVPGNTMVFKARSRAERDHWVLAIQTECERLAQAEEVRIVGEV
ncbi:putative ph domain protein [Diplodia seriata]|uniref:Putative ph domain protein n=1 Tax=Diplodia seriata TaxID=420778 RepID=A0A0G2ELV1_9PEZI|nr:putative ph domain protein [Diplodia seriata]